MFKAMSFSFMIKNIQYNTKGHSIGRMHSSVGRMHSVGRREVRMLHAQTKKRFTEEQRRYKGMPKAGCTYSGLAHACCVTLAQYLIPLLSCGFFSFLSNDPENN